MSDKRIVLDGITLKFLRELRNIRNQRGLTVRRVSLKLGLSLGLLTHYESGRVLPGLSRLIKLAKYYEYDISRSINYKFYHGKINPDDINAELERYGLSPLELSEITGYQATRIRDAVNIKHGTLLCLGVIFEIIKQKRKEQGVMIKFFGSKWEFYKRCKSDNTDTIWSLPDEQEIMPLKIAVLSTSKRVERGVIESNGRLIAAAPELYDLLKNAPQQKSEISSWLKRRNALLARIEGGE